ncbi:MAG: M50 family metallopeptidase [Nanoarchaeota archaeon]|nr:M50 family metallopeptidase [Nanoarchaeota archaeon]
MLFTINEIIDLIIMTAALGYIFMDYIKSPASLTESILSKRKFDWDNFKFAALVTAPGIILHEMSHKFVGLALGITTQFNASYFGLFLGIFLKWISSPFIIFAPGYVSLAGSISDFQRFLTAFSGPAANLLLFAIAYTILDRKKNLTRNQAIALHLTKQINLFLFLFNLIPLPPFDGYSVFSSLFRMIF